MFDAVVNFRLNDCMPQLLTKSTSSSSVQNVTLTNKMIKAAKKAVRHGGILHEKFEECSYEFGVAPDVVDFKFVTPGQAKKGELLLCELLARSNPVVVDKFIRDFQNRYKQVLKPVFLTLSDFKNKSSGQRSKNQKLQKCQKNLRDWQTESEKLVDNLKRQKKSQTWGEVATAWVRLNEILAESAGLRIEILCLEQIWNRASGNKRLNRAPTAPVVRPQIDPVVRTECEIRVPFDLLFSTGLNSIYKTIADTIPTNSQKPVTIDEMELASKFDELFNHCGPLACDFCDDDEIHPNRLLDIEDKFKKLISAQAKFLKQFLAPSNGIITSDAGERGGGQSATDKPNEDVPDRGARFENNYSLAVIHSGNGKTHRLTIEQELRGILCQIATAGGSLQRTHLVKDKPSTYQPEKLFRSKVAKALLDAGLLVNEKNGRTNVYSVKERV